MGQAADGQPCHQPALAGSRGTCASARGSDAGMPSLSFTSCSPPPLGHCGAFLLYGGTVGNIFTISVHFYPRKLVALPLNHFLDASITNPANTAILKQW